jgi:hypothetical protein
MVSIVINADTRAGFQENHTEATEMFKGCVSEDFLTAGIFNKIKFLEGFEKEVILFVDEHQQIPDSTLAYIRAMADVVVIRKHTNEPKFNDYNYVSALQLARGEIIFHFDQDCAAFTSSQEPIKLLINLLEKYDYISYPSHWTPYAVDDPNYDYMWCSTRFFMCKRETLDFTEITKCLKDSDYLYGKYPASIRNPWTEHCLGLISKYNGKGVYYPPVHLDQYAIFSWASYEKGLLGKLNDFSYEAVKHFITSKGGIQYPNDIRL